jgi:hypothetical protein
LQRERGRSARLLTRLYTAMAARRAALVACSLCTAAALVPPAAKPQRHLQCQAAPAERSIDASHPMFRKLLTVRGPAMNRRGESRHANLKCFAEPGDPYGKPLPYVLAHGDLIICLDYEDFAGQTWVLHEVDERARGLRKDGAQPSSEKYLAWSHMDFCGHRWLVDETMERRDDNSDDEAEFGAMLPEAKRMLREMAKLKSAGAANAADALAALERIERIDFPP